MGKEIILPWSCETSDKVQSCFKWIVLITSPIVFIFMIVGMNNEKISDEVGQYGIIVFVYGVFGSMISWMYQLVEWHMYGWPIYFSCKRPKLEKVE